MRAVGAVDRAAVRCASRSGGQPSTTSIARLLRWPRRSWPSGSATGRAIRSKSSSRRPSPANTPKLVQKGTKAAAAEAAEVAAETEAAVQHEQTERLAPEVEALGGGACTAAQSVAVEAADAAAASKCHTKSRCCRTRGSHALGRAWPGERFQTASVEALAVGVHLVKQGQPCRTLCLHCRGELRLHAKKPKAQPLSPAPASR